jgi:hypothetical protein
MQHLAVVVMLLLLVGPAFAANPEPKATEANVLASAKQLSATECDPKKWKKQSEFVGCTFWAAFIDGEWWVTKVYDFEHQGQRTHASGGSIYIFSRTGKLIKMVGGM